MRTQIDSFIPSGLHSMPLRCEDMAVDANWSRWVYINREFFYQVIKVMELEK